MIDPASPYLSYVAAAYGACAVVLGGMTWRAWRGWRRVRDAWDRVQRRDRP